MDVLCVLWIIVCDGNLEAVRLKELVLVQHLVKVEVRVGDLVSHQPALGAQELRERLELAGQRGLVVCLQASLQPHGHWVLEQGN